MIRISEDEKEVRFLKYSSIDTYNRFNKYVEKLGINIDKYHKFGYDLLSNNIIVPSLSIQLPNEYYENWENYPEYPKKCIDDRIEDKWGILYGMYWNTDKSEDEWYLHPFDRREKARCYDLEYLKVTAQNGEIFDHPNGHKYSKNNTYVPYWQVYRLLEIDNIAEDTININMLLNPQSKISRIYEKCSVLIKDFEDRISSIKNKWDNKYYVLSYISYYRTLHGISLGMEKRGNGNYYDLIREGEKQLRLKLSLDIEQLEYCAREIYLKNYQDVKTKSSSKYPGIITLMQKDIYYLTEWLCYANNKTFDYYFEKYENKSRFYDGYTDLIDVLPFESEKEEKYRNFLLTPYIDEINKHSSKIIIDEKSLSDVFRSLRDKCSSFYIFSRSLSKMKSEWNKEFEIEFDNSSLMDYLVLLSIKSETLLKELISGNDEADMMLEKIIKKYSKALGKDYEYRHGFDFCLGNWSSYTKSWIGFDKVTEFVKQTSISDNDKWFAQTILIFAQARNYFVHCYNYDNTNIDLDKLGLVTKSIIISVLLLSYSYLKKIAEQSLQPDSMPCHDSC